LTSLRHKERAIERNADVRTNRKSYIKLETKMIAKKIEKECIKFILTVKSTDRENYK
jgi:hypothetical protein